MDFDRSAVTEDYHKRLPTYKHLQGEALFVLDSHFKDAGFKIHSTPSRIKGLDSLLATAERKDLSDPLSELNDIVGVRVVCLFTDDIAKVAGIVRKHFRVLDEENKVDGFDATQFGYMSVHFVVKLSDEYHGPRYDSVKEIPFEIQVRTIAMDAWASISHHLDYKSEEAIPTELRRDFFALSGLFYVADKHFELFFRATAKSRKEKAREYVRGGERPEDELNLDTLQALLVTRFADRDHSGPDTVAELFKELYHAGLRTIGQLGALIDEAEKIFPDYERNNPPSGKLGERYTDVGAVRMMMGIVAPEFRQARYKNAKSRARFEEFRKRLAEKSDHPTD